jgi:integrase
MLITTYAAGLRVSEVCQLRPEHIKSERGQILRRSPSSPHLGIYELLLRLLRWIDPGRLLR